MTNSTGSGPRFCGFRFQLSYLSQLSCVILGLLVTWPHYYHTEYLPKPCGREKTCVTTGHRLSQEETRCADTHAQTFQKALWPSKSARREQAKNKSTPVPEFLCKKFQWRPLPTARPRTQVSVNQNHFIFSVKQDFLCFSDYRSSQCCGIRR